MKKVSGSRVYLQERVHVASCSLILETDEPRVLLGIPADPVWGVGRYLHLEGHRVILCVNVINISTDVLRIFNCIFNCIYIRTHLLLSYLWVHLTYGANICPSCESNLGLFNHDCFALPPLHQGAAITNHNTQIFKTICIL